MFYVYILKSKKDNGVYIGYTSDLRSRYIQHQSGLVESTKNRLPVDLIYYEAYNAESAARERENKLKEFGSSYTGLMKRLKLRDKS